MRNSIATMTLIAVIAGLASGSAEAGKTKYKYKYKFKGKKKVTVIHKVKTPKPKFGLSFGFPSPVHIKAGPIVVSVPPVIIGSPAIPAFTYRYERVWVPEVRETVFVGFGFFGIPMYREVVVQSGHWKRAQYKVFSSGRRLFIGYVR